MTLIRSDNARKPAKGMGIKLMALAIILLLFSVQVSAAAPASAGKGKVGSFTKGLVEEAIRKGWQAASILVVWDVKNFFYSLYDNLIPLILANPPIHAVRGFMGFFITLLQPYYILAIILLGFQLIFISTSPEERSNIKTLLGWFIVSLILISLSPAILLVLMEISRMLAILILGIADPNLGIRVMKSGTDVLFDFFRVLNFIDMSGGTELGVLDFGFLQLLYFMLILRYMMVGLWGILFPVTIFFYSIKPLRVLGKSMFAQTIIWMFVQVAWAIGLIAVAVSFAGIQQAYPLFPLRYVYMASFIMFFASPMVIVGIMDWLSLGFYVFGTVASTPVSQGAGFVDSATISRGLIDEEEVVIKPVS